MDNGRDGRIGGAHQTTIRYGDPFGASVVGESVVRVCSDVVWIYGAAGFGRTVVVMDM